MSDKHDWDEVLRAVISQVNFAFALEKNPDFAAEKQQEVRQKYLFLKAGFERLSSVIGHSSLVRIGVDSPLQTHTLDWTEDGVPVQSEVIVDFDGTIFIRTRRHPGDAELETLTRQELQSPEDALRQVYATAHRVVAKSRAGSGLSP